MKSTISFRTVFLGSSLLVLPWLGSLMANGILVIVFLVALIGAAIASVDSQKGWENFKTLFTIFMLVGVALVFAYTNEPKLLTWFGGTLIFAAMASCVEW